MDEVDTRKIQEQKRERETAEVISRHLAHLRLQHEEGTKGYGLIDAKNPNFHGDVRKALEAYEAGLVDLPDEAVVALIEDTLLRNKFDKLRFATGSDGACLAYPRLMNAVENQIDHARSKEEEASAYAVKACMEHATDRDDSSVKFFKKALQRRPKDWRLLNAIAMVYVLMYKEALSLDAFNRAIEVVDEKSFERFDMEFRRGSVLYNLRRFEEAKFVFLKVNIDVERYRDELNLSILARAYFIESEYLLTLIWVQENNTKMIKHQWNSAEAKRKALPPDIHKRINWNSSLFAEEIIKEIHPGFLGNKECSYCRQLCLDPMICSGCKNAQYCNAACQKAHWKAGHKRHCQAAKTTRKTNKKDRKESIEKLEAAMSLPPLDATLDPRDLWAKAKKLSKDPSKALDSVFLFTVALFLDFALMEEDMSAARNAFDSCDTRHPLALALRMIPKMHDTKKRGVIVSCIASNHSLAIDYMKNYSATSDNDHYYAETLDQLDRVQFGFAMCIIFRVRLSIHWLVTSSKFCDNRSPSKLCDDRLELIRDVEKILPSGRWLTIQFEIACSNFDVAATDEAKHWLQIFVDNLTNLEFNEGIKLAKHWKRSRTIALDKWLMIPFMKSETFWNLHLQS